MDWADSLPDDYVRWKVENIYGDKQEEITAMQTEVEANAKTYIKGDVDSQNWFGAMWRTKFVCAIGGDINCFYDWDDAESKLAYDWMISLFNIMKKRH
jgi:hypothetical protein